MWITSAKPRERERERENSAENCSVPRDPVLSLEVPEEL